MFTIKWCLLNWLIKAHGTRLLSRDAVQLAGSEICKMEEEHLNIKMAAFLLICNAVILLIYLEMCDLIINRLKEAPTGVPTLKNIMIFERLSKNNCHLSMECS